MASYMARVYAEVIRKTAETGKTIDDVPEIIRGEVEELLGEINEASNVISEETSKQSIEELAVTIRARVSAGENLRAIIGSLELTDEEKWELEKKVKEG